LEDSRISERVKEEYKMQTIPLREYREQIKLENAKEEGIEEGLEKGRFEVARSMLAEGISAEIVKKCTGLGEKEFINLR
jgi:predicted transposase/invertase (TIGR01784 family)